MFPAFLNSFGDKIQCPVGTHSSIEAMTQVHIETVEDSPNVKIFFWCEDGHRFYLSFESQNNSIDFKCVEEKDWTNLEGTAPAILNQAS